jgi:dipeptidyl aminopeptidase/acylaminoacyl peptidase
MTPLPTDTPSPTPTPPHPLDIENMRRHTYPGSDLVFEETLEPGSNYDRYIVSYRSEGLKIYAYLTIPRGEAPASGWPVVIFNHGYIPPAEYRSTERYLAYVDAFARRGYIVVRSDYRGHGNSEGDASSGSRTPDYTIDVLNAVGSIKRYKDADPDRIGMWGHSMGGGITLRCMVVTDDIVAGVIWAGTVAPYPQLLTRYMRTPTPGAADATPRPRRRWAAEMLEQYGSPEENPSFWGAISANTYVGDLSGTIQLHHGTADQSVPLEYSLLLEEQITAVGKPVELYTYEGDDHNIARNWGTAMGRSVEFMDRYVKAARQGL